MDELLQWIFVGIIFILILVRLIYKLFIKKTSQGDSCECMKCKLKDNCKK